MRRNNFIGSLRSQVHIFTLRPNGAVGALVKRCWRLWRPRPGDAVVRGSLLAGVLEHQEGRSVDVLIEADTWR
jgi:hypothetical protein